MNPSRPQPRIAPALAAIVALGFCAAVSAADATYPYFRFTQTKLRDNGAANSIQLSEFRFIKTGVPLSLAGVTVTNPGGDSPGGEPPSALVDGDLGSKWLDFNKQAVVFRFPDGADPGTDPDPVTIDAYNFATANDSEERDPVSWKFEGSTNGVDWNPIDTRTDYPTTTARDTFQTPFAVPGGAIVQSFQASKYVVLNSNPLALSWATLFANGGVSIDNGIGPVAASGSQPVSPPDNSDTTYTLTATGNEGPVQSALTVRTVVGGTVNYRYVRFTPEKLRNNAAANSIQLGEFFLVDGITVLTPVGATNPGGNNPGGGGEGPGQAIDGNFATKWLDFNKQGLVLDLGAVVEFDSYGFVTGNDATERDPVRWLLEGSVDGNGWTLIENFTAYDFPMPTARSAPTQDIPLPGPSLGPAISFFVSDAPKLIDGEPLLLSWDVSGATSVTISGIGPVAGSGSMTVHPLVDTTYTLTATNAVPKVKTGSVSVVIIDPAITAINYPNFDAAGDELSLVNVAVVVNDFANLPLPGNVKRLRITPNLDSKTGAAWFGKRIDFSTGFQCFFDFQFNTVIGDGADGMAFVIQNTPTGIGNIPGTEQENGFAKNALNIKFDSYDNDGAQTAEPSSAFIQVRAGNTVLATSNLLGFPALLPLPGGDDLTVEGGAAAPYQVRVDYVPGDLDVYFNGVQVVDSVNVNLALIGAVNASGKGYVGFTGRTGGAFESHDVTRWQLTAGPPPPPLAIRSFSLNLATDQLSVTWGSSPARTYRITSSTNLLNWTTVLASGIPGAAGMQETSTSVGFIEDTKAFFRVEEE